MSGSLLTVSDLDAGYGRVQVLHELSIEAGRFGNVGLFGPNGHGKTTLLRVISRLLRATSGAVTFDGADISAETPRSIVERGLVHVPQGNRLFPDLTVGECLTLGAYTPKARAKEAENRERVLKIFPKIGERWRQRVRTLSGGERQMTSIGV